MIVTTSYSSRLRDRMRPEDWHAIHAAGPGEVRFSRGFGGRFCAELRRDGTVVHASHPTSPRAAFDAALRELDTAPEMLA